MAAKHDSKYDDGVGKHLLPKQTTISLPSRVYIHTSPSSETLLPLPPQTPKPPPHLSHTTIATIDTIATISLNPVSAPELPKPSSPCAPEPSGRGRVPPQSAAPQMSSQN
ncbi:hypothetical protein KC19_2G137100 [Ceratodon purpureus]|uniref:Uncharacterized protein n=1 Tax=Ceratodon purpureus TaxID=3225 RepID=A0A8T0IVR8_CERPU|nr:hypothetical protein KC19_2G137100 [Ceratodon purpureus]